MRSGENIGLIAQYARSEDGQATTEFALALPLFLLVFLGLVEFAHLFYVELSLQQALHTTARYMVTGQTNVPDPSDPTKNLPRCAAMMEIFKQQLVGTGAGLVSLTPTVVIDMNQPNSDCGGPDDTVQLTAVFEKPFFSGIFRFFAPGFPSSVTFTLSTMWKNEGYS